MSSTGKSTGAKLGRLSALLLAGTLATPAFASVFIEQVEVANASADGAAGLVSVRPAIPVDDRAQAPIADDVSPAFALRRAAVCTHDCAFLDGVPLTGGAGVDLPAPDIPALDIPALEMVDGLLVVRLPLPGR